MWPWRVKMPTQNLLKSLLLLMMMVLATICCRFETWGFVKKLNFCSDFEHKVWSRFEVEAQARFDAGVWSVFCCWCFVKVMLNQSWILVEIVKLGLVKILNFKFYREAHVWLRIWRWCLVEILKMKFDQDLCLNSWYELNPRVRCAFGNVCILSSPPSMPCPRE